MDMVEIIEKKKDKQKLTKEEIEYVVNSYTKGDIPDYQMSALLMAIVLNGMTKEETFYMTEVMENSGDVFDLSRFNGKVVDKHSTGGIGDKTTIIIGPILAALGCKVAKVSGKGLGITGGTADKLESISGYNIALSKDEFINQVADIGISLSYNIGNLAPADKKIYALRDVTGTVRSIPLVASSIMSKKLASGADAIILDVKVGKGAFMKTIEEARELAKLMIEIGSYFGKKVKAVLTNMDIPLGYNIGNRIEVEECIDVLSGKGEHDLTLISVLLASHLYNMISNKPLSECQELVLETISSGKALEKLKELIKAQGGNYNSIFENNNNKYTLKATSSGYVTDINSELAGLASREIKVGRESKEDAVDPEAGIVLLKKINDPVLIGEAIATIYYKEEKDLQEAMEYLEKMVTISDKEVEPPKIIYEVIG